MMLSNKLYDILKPVAQYVLPAMAALYGALSQTWMLPYSEQVVGTIMVIDVLMGAILDMSKSQYQIKMTAAFGYSVASQPALPEVDPNMPKWYMPKDVYDGLLWFAQVFLPALGTAYFGLATIWKFPFPEQVVATIAAVDTFLGVILAISTYELKKALTAMTKPQVD